MVGPLAILVLALDDCTLGVFSARLGVAANLHLQLAELALNYLVAIILEPDALEPVDADHMGPQVVCVGLSFFTQSDWLEDSIELRAQKAFYFSAFLRWLGKQYSAPCAVPVAGGDLTNKLTTVARLMDTDKAEVTDDNLVVLVIIIVEAHIAHNVLIIHVLVKSDLLIWVPWIDLIAIDQGLVIVIHLHLLLHLLLLILSVMLQLANISLT